MTEPALNTLAPVNAQQDWLDNEDVNEIAFPQRGETDKREHREQALSLIRSDHWAPTKAFLRQFISRCLFRPQATEKQWWSLTAPLNSNFIRLNLARQEILQITLSINFEFRVLLTDSILSNSDRQFICELDNTTISPSPRSVVNDQLEIRSNNFAIFDRIMSRTNICKAIKNLSLRLMKKQKSTSNKYHCFTLLDDIFGNTRPIGLPEVAMPIVDDQKLYDTEVKRLVWMRANVARFSSPVK